MEGRRLPIALNLCPKDISISGHYYYYLIPDIAVLYGHFIAILNSITSKIDQYCSILVDHKVLHIVKN